MQTDRFFSLVKQLIGKDLVTEVDSPSDFSMGNSSGSGEVNTGAEVSGTDVSSTTDVSDTTNSDTNSDSDELSDLGLPDSGLGGAGLSPSYDVDIDVDNEDQPDQQDVAPAAPKYRILDVKFDEDDDLNTKVKIQNLDTGKVEIKNLDEIII